MKYIKQFAIILGVTCVAEVMKYLIPLPIPASIYGLVLLFVLLCTHIIPVSAVKESGEFLIEIMPMLFIPAAVGLLTVWDVLKPMLVPVAVVMVFTTILVMGVTGLVTQGVLRKKESAPADEEVSEEIAPLMMNEEVEA